MKFEFLAAILFFIWILTVQLVKFILRLYLKEKRNQARLVKLLQYQNRVYKATIKTLIAQGSPNLT